MADTTIRAAKTRDDAILIHRLLMIVAPTGPLLGPIDPVKSLTEVWRVVEQEYALMGFAGDTLVGSLGIMRADLWYSKQHFFTNRWFHFLPQFRGGPLASEMEEIAQDLAKRNDGQFVLYRERWSRRGVRVVGTVNDE